MWVNGVRSSWLTIVMNELLRSFSSSARWVASSRSRMLSFSCSYSSEFCSATTACVARISSVSTVPRLGLRRSTGSSTER